MLSNDRVQQIIMSKDVENAEYGESWAIIDNRRTGCRITGTRTATHLSSSWKGG
jgi:hypothetical protein